MITDIFQNCDMPEVKKKLEEKPALVPEDVADAVLYALGTPPHVQVSTLKCKQKYIYESGAY